MKIKNLRAGWVVIPDAGLKLKSGQVAEVEKISPQTQMFIEKGYIARMDSPAEKAPEATEKPVSPESGQKSDYKEALAAYGDLSPKKAAEFVRKATDIGLLQTIKVKETRENVIDDLNARIKELGGV